MIKLIRLNLGCGTDVKEGWINYDKNPVDKRVKKINLENNLRRESNSVDEILLDNVLEHIHRYENLIDNCHRVLKPNGTLTIKVPYFRQCGAFRLDHKRFFTLREAPKLIREFSYCKITLHFLTSEKPYMVVLEWFPMIVAFLNWKFYEYYLSGIFPASEIEIILVK